MKGRILRKKPVQLAAVLALAVGIVLAGTFAWSNFNQSRINVFRDLSLPGVNLHDDFEGGPNKDVYVENSGDRPIYLRVRLTEFLQTDGRGPLVEGQLRDDAKAYLWAPHNATDPADGAAGAVDRCVLTGGNTQAPGWAGETFHDYYTWFMGGQAETNPTAQIYYKPAAPEQKGVFSEDGKTVLQEPQVVSDPLTGTSTAGDASVDYAASVAAKIEELRAADTGDPKKTDAQLETEALAELGLKKTQTAYVITMADWIEGKGAAGDPDYRPVFAQGDFWVIDQSDGWAYWANGLDKGQATGLLLDKVVRTDRKFDSSAEYAINAWLQAVTEDDLGQFAANGGGISADGMKLLQLAAGKIAITADGGTYQINGDGSYTQLTNADGAPVENAKPFAALAVDSQGASLGVNAPAESRIALGTRVKLADLGWNGESYANYEALSAAPNNGWYNLSAAEDGAYEVTGVGTGQNGLIYLTLCPVVDGAADLDAPIYLTSIVKEGAVAAFSAEPEAAPAAVPVYRPANPGAGPYAPIYPGTDGAPGTADDSLHPIGDFTEPFLQGRTSAELKEGGILTADGVEWVVAAVDKYGNRLVLAKSLLITSTQASPYAASGLAAECKTYYTDSMPRLKPYVLDAELPVETGAFSGSRNEAGALSRARSTQDDPIIFAMSQSEWITYDVSHKQGFGSTAVLWTRSPIDANSSVVAKIGSGHSVTFASRANTSPCGAIVAAWVRFSDADEIATATAAEMEMWKTRGLTEDFLAGKTSDELAAGGTFTADGYDWVVLDADAHGNRLITTTKPAGANGATVGIFGSNTTYSGSNAALMQKKFLDETCITLKPYTQSACIPLNGLTTAMTAATGERSAFLMSRAEFERYESTLLASWKGNGCGTCWLRSSTQTAGEVDTVFYDRRTAPLSLTLGSSAPDTANSGSGWYWWPALWVRFSDADLIATASKEYQAKWESGIPLSNPSVGSTFALDGYDWLVLDKDSSGNILISTPKAAYTTQANSSSTITWDYNTSLLKTSVQNFYDRELQALKPYVKNATTNVEPDGTTAGGITSPNFGTKANYDKWVQALKVDAARSTATTGTGTAFVLSASDLQFTAASYPGGADAFTSSYLNNGNNSDGFWLRTRGYASGGTGVAYASVISDAYSNAIHSVRPALWVSFA